MDNAIKIEHQQDDKDKDKDGGEEKELSIQLKRMDSIIENFDEISRRNPSDKDQISNGQVRRSDDFLSNYVSKGKGAPL